MATLPRIIHGPDEGWNITRSPVASGTALSRGDFVSYESNAAVLLDSVGEDATFIGLANTAHVANEPAGNLVTLLRCVAECDCTSDTYTLGAPVMYTSLNCLVDATSATTLAWSHRYTGSTAVTRHAFVFDVIALQKLFALT